MNEMNFFHDKYTINLQAGLITDNHFVDAYSYKSDPFNIDFVGMTYDRELFNNIHVIGQYVQGKYDLHNKDFHKVEDYNFKNIGIVKSHILNNHDKLGFIMNFHDQNKSITDVNLNDLLSKPDFMSLQYYTKINKNSSFNTMISHYVNGNNRITFAYSITQ